MPTPFTITRSFAAPRAAVWAAWTEPERIAAWMGPKGSGAGQVHRHELRPGGMLHSSYAPPGGGGRMWGKHVYREVTPWTVWSGSTRSPTRPVA